MEAFLDYLLTLVREAGCGSLGDSVQIVEWLIFYLLDDRIEGHFCLLQFQYLGIHPMHPSKEGFLTHWLIKT